MIGLVASALRGPVLGMPDGTSKRYTAPALEKGLDIIELLAHARTPMTMTEIGARIGRSKSQIFRNLRILEERGYIARADNDDRFALTNKLFEMGMRSPPAANLVEIAHPIMAEAARTLDQSVHLAVASRGQMVVVARLESPGEIGFAVPIGHRRLLPEGASGRVLLAFQPAHVREQWLQIVRDSNAGLDEPALLRRLKTIAARGYERSKSARVLGVTDISLPVGAPDGHAVAALTTPYIMRRDHANDLDAAILVMRDAARRIGESLAAPLGRPR
jgi:DNA-binding IclR family transcriptional regulator